MRMFRDIQNVWDNNVQRVFDIVIDAECYRYGIDYMCVALDIAKRDGLISWLDVIVCKVAIAAYIRPHDTLESSLLINNLPTGYENRLHIYKNWRWRPELIK